MTGNTSAFYFAKGQDITFVETDGGVEVVVPRRRPKSRVLGLFACLMFLAFFLALCWWAHRLVGLLITLGTAGFVAFLATMWWLEGTDISGRAARIRADRQGLWIQTERTLDPPSEEFFVRDQILDITARLLHSHRRSICGGELRVYVKGRDTPRTYLSHCAPEEIAEVAGRLRRALDMPPQKVNDANLLAGLVRSLTSK